VFIGAWKVRFLSVRCWAKRRRTGVESFRRNFTELPRRCILGSPEGIKRATPVPFDESKPYSSSPPGQEGSLGEGAAGPLCELAVQAEKIRAVVAAGEETGVPLVVNARTDTYWRSVGDDPGRRFSQTVHRGNAFLEAGADCVFVPGVKDPETILGLAREISGPLNVLAGPSVPPIPKLADLGVRRVSVGSGPARAVMGLVRRIGQELLDGGTYTSLSEGAVAYEEANRLFSEGGG